MIKSLKLTDDEQLALAKRVERLNRLADRALDESNDRKAERLTDRADALDLALFRYYATDAIGDEGLTASDVLLIQDALERERSGGHLDRA